MPESSAFTLKFLFLAWSILLEAGLHVSYSHWTIDKQSAMLLYMKAVIMQSVKHHEQGSSLNLVDTCIKKPNQFLQ